MKLDDALAVSQQVSDFFAEQGLRIRDTQDLISGESNTLVILMKGRVPVPAGQDAKGEDVFKMEPKSLTMQFDNPDAVNVARAFISHAKNSDADLGHKATPTGPQNYSFPTPRGW